MPFADRRRLLVALHQLNSGDDNFLRRVSSSSSSSSRRGGTGTNIAAGGAAAAHGISTRTGRTTGTSTSSSSTTTTRPSSSSFKEHQSRQQHQKQERQQQRQRKEVRDLASSPGTSAVPPALPKNSTVQALPSESLSSSASSFMSKSKKPQEANQLKSLSGSNAAAAVVGDRGGGGRFDAASRRPRPRKPDQESRNHIGKKHQGETASSAVDSSRHHQQRYDSPQPQEKSSTARRGDKEQQRIGKSGGPRVLSRTSHSDRDSSMERRDQRGAEESSDKESDDGPADADPSSSSFSRAVTAPSLASGSSALREYLQSLRKSDSERNKNDEDRARAVENDEDDNYAKRDGAVSPRQLSAKSSSNRHKQSVVVDRAQMDRSSTSRAVGSHGESQAGPAAGADDVDSGPKSARRKKKLAEKHSSSSTTESVNPAMLASTAKSPAKQQHSGGRGPSSASKSRASSASSTTSNASSRYAVAHLDILVAGSNSLDAPPPLPETPTGSPRVTARRTTGPNRRSGSQPLKMSGSITNALMTSLTTTAGASGAGGSSGLGGSGRRKSIGSDVSAQQQNDRRRRRRSSASQRDVVLGRESSNELFFGSDRSSPRSNASPRSNRSTPRSARSGSPRSVLGDLIDATAVFPNVTGSGAAERGAPVRSRTSSLSYSVMRAAAEDEHSDASNDNDDDDGADNSAHTDRSGSHHASGITRQRSGSSGTSSSRSNRPLSSSSNSSNTRMRSNSGSRPRSNSGSRQRSGSQSSLHSLVAANTAARRRSRSIEHINAVAALGAPPISKTPSASGDIDSGAADFLGSDSSSSLLVAGLSEYSLGHTRSADELIAVAEAATASLLAAGSTRSTSPPASRTLSPRSASPTSAGMSRRRRLSKGSHSSSKDRGSRSGGEDRLGRNGSQRSSKARSARSPSPRAKSIVHAPPTTAAGLCEICGRLVDDPRQSLCRVCSEDGDLVAHMSGAAQGGLPSDGVDSRPSSAGPLSPTVAMLPLGEVNAALRHGIGSDSEIIGPDTARRLREKLDERQRRRELKLQSKAKRRSFGNESDEDSTERLYLDDRARAMDDERASRHPPKSGSKNKRSASGGKSFMASLVGSGGIRSTDRVNRKRRPNRHPHRAHRSLSDGELDVGDSDNDEDSNISDSKIRSSAKRRSGSDLQRSDSGSSSDSSALSSESRVLSIVEPSGELAAVSKHVILRIVCAERQQGGATTGPTTSSPSTSIVSILPAFPPLYYTFDESSVTVLHVLDKLSTSELVQSQMESASFGHSGAMFSLAVRAGTSTRSDSSEPAFRVPADDRNGPVLPVSELELSLTLSGAGISEQGSSSSVGSTISISGAMTSRQRRKASDLITTVFFVVGDKASLSQDDVRRHCWTPLTFLSTERGDETKVSSFSSPAPVSTSTTGAAVVDVLSVILSNRALAEAFRRYHILTYQVENFYFWKAVESYRLLKDDREARRRRAQALWDIFIARGASYELNLPASLRKSLEAGLQEAEETLYDSAQSTVSELMRHNAVRAFCSEVGLPDLEK